MPIYLPPICLKCALDVNLKRLQPQLLQVMIDWPAATLLQPYFAPNYMPQDPLQLPDMAYLLHLGVYLGVYLGVKYLVFLAPLNFYLGVIFVNPKMSAYLNLCRNIRQFSLDRYNLALILLFRN